MTCSIRGLRDVFWPMDCFPGMQVELMCAFHPGQEKANFLTTGGIVPDTRMAGMEPHPTPDYEHGGSGSLTGSNLELFCGGWPVRDTNLFLHFSF